MIISILTWQNVEYCEKDFFSEIFSPNWRNCESKSPKQFLRDIFSKKYFWEFFSPKKLRGLRNKILNLIERLVQNLWKEILFFWHTAFWPIKQSFLSIITRWNHEVCKLLNLQHKQAVLYWTKIALLCTQAYFLGH